jgi:hypothetical protein
LDFFDCIQHLTKTVTTGKIVDKKIHLTSWNRDKITFSTEVLRVSEVSLFNTDQAAQLARPYSARTCRVNWKE